MDVDLFQVSYDTWHHYMLSWDGKVIKVYVDSVLSEQTELSGEVTKLAGVNVIVTQIVMYLINKYNDNRLLQ